MYPLYWEYNEVNDKYFRKIENECDFFFSRGVYPKAIGEHHDTR